MYSKLELLKNHLKPNNNNSKNKNIKNNNNENIGEREYFTPILFRYRFDKKETETRDESKREFKQNDNYFMSQASLIGIKPLNTNYETIYDTREPTSKVMQKYCKHKRDKRRSLKFGYASPKLVLRVDTQYQFHLDAMNTNKSTQKLSFDIRHISAYGSHYDYLDVFSIIVVDELFDFVPTCLVFRFPCLKDRHKMAESFIDTLNYIRSDLNGIFAWDSALDVSLDSM